MPAQGGDVSNSTTDIVPAHVCVFVPTSTSSALRWVCLRCGRITSLSMLEGNATTLGRWG